MRTTIRIDDDLLDRLKSEAVREGMSLTRLVNRVLRAGLVAEERVADQPRYAETTFPMGAPRVDLTGALELATALEDAETLRKLSLNK